MILSTSSTIFRMELRRTLLSHKQVSNIKTAFYFGGGRPILISFLFETFLFATFSDRRDHACYESMISFSRHLHQSK